MITPRVRRALTRAPRSMSLASFWRSAEGRGSAARGAQGVSARPLRPAGPVHTAEGDLWLSPETRLLADAPGCDDYEYDGAGHRLVGARRPCLPAHAPMTSWARCELGVAAVRPLGVCLCCVA